MTKRKKRDKNISVYFAIAFSVAVFALSFSLPVGAWIDPTAMPPANNTFAPIHVGPVHQKTEGTLVIGANNYTSTTTQHGLIVRRGRFSIGTVNPVNDFQVLYPPASGTVYFGNQNIGVTPYNFDVRFSNINFSSPITIGYPTANTHAARVDWVLGEIAAATTSIAFWDDDASGAHIFNMNPGNVGIGTNIPTAILHVNKLGVTTTIGTKDSRLILQNDTSTVNAGSEVVFAYTDTGVDRYGAIGAAAVTNTAGGGTGRVYIATKATEADVSLTERLSIIPNGNVGIGNTNPVTKLSVSGPTTSNGGNYNQMGANDVLGGMIATYSGWNSCGSIYLTDSQVGSYCLGNDGAYAEWDVTGERYNLDSGTYHLLVGGHWWPNDIVSGGTDDNLGFQIDFYDSSDSVWRTAGTFTGVGWFSVNTPAGIASGDTTRVRFTVIDDRSGEARVSEVHLYTTQVSGGWINTFIGGQRGYLSNLTSGSINIGINGTTGYGLYVNGTSNFTNTMTIAYPVNATDAARVDWVNGQVAAASFWADRGANRISNSNTSVVGIGTANPDATYALHVVGDIFVDGEIVVSGSDLAEEFVTDQDYEAGTVLIMGEQGFKSAEACSKEYDGTVVGVVSDMASIIIGRVEAPHEAIVAMTGVVRAKVNDSNGLIKKGDLLATSGISGEAMLAAEPRIGTVIGKALEDASAGKDEIMVLVNLQ